MRVAALQFKPNHAEPERSRARLRSWLRAAPERALVVLPEMCVSGYIFRDRAHIAPFAEPARGPTFEALAPLAAEGRRWLVVGFAERDRDRLFNSALVIDPRGGLAGVYRKTLLFEADTTWATPGDTGYLRLDTEQGALAVGICMDLNDDRFTGWLQAQRAELLAFPTNWVEEYSDVHAYWRERLAGVPSVLVAANSYGAEGRVRFSGRSAVMREGRLLGALFKTGDGLLSVTASR
jgi:predicted amidohydrolase